MNISKAGKGRTPEFEVLQTNSEFTIFFLQYLLAWSQGNSKLRSETMLHKQRDQRETLQFWFEKQKSKLLKFRESGESVEGGDLLTFFLYFFSILLHSITRWSCRQKSEAGETSFLFNGAAISSVDSARQVIFFFSFCIPFSCHMALELMQSQKRTVFN